MPSPVELERLGAARWQVLCGGCLKTGGPIDAATDEDAWRPLDAVWWTVHRFSPGSCAYPKCGTCSAKPPGQVPPRGKRRHR